MVKTRITVSVKKSVVDNAKRALSKKGRTLSDYVETALRSLSTSEILHDMRRELNFHCEYISWEYIEKNRPDLTDKVHSETEVRKMRNDRVLRLY